MGTLNEIEIQIRPDGYITFSALTAELLELAAAICPNDPDIQRRVAILRQARMDPRIANIHAEEQPDGLVQSE